jgi:hypothetical protein
MTLSIVASHPQSPAAKEKQRCHRQHHTGIERLDHRAPWRRGCALRVEDRFDIWSNNDVGMELTFTARRVNERVTVPTQRWMGRKENAPQTIVARGRAQACWMEAAKVSKYSRPGRIFRLDRPVGPAIRARDATDPRAGSVDGESRTSPYTHRSRDFRANSSRDSAKASHSAY